MIKPNMALILDEENKSSNGNSADTEGEEESEIGEKSLDKNTAAANKLHYQPVSHLQDKNRKHDPNRYSLPSSILLSFKVRRVNAIKWTFLDFFRNDNICPDLIALLEVFRVAQACCKKLLFKKRCCKQFKLSICM